MTAEIPNQGEVHPMFMTKMGGTPYALENSKSEIKSFEIFSASDNRLSETAPEGMEYLFRGVKGNWDHSRNQHHFFSGFLDTAKMYAGEGGTIARVMVSRDFIQSLRTYGVWRTEGMDFDVELPNHWFKKIPY